MPDLPTCEMLVLERKYSRLYVTINRPDSRNALTAEVVAELTAVVEAVAPDRTIRTLILRGAGGTFCAGGDIKGFRASFTAPPPEPGQLDPIAVSNRTFGDFMIKFDALPQTVIGVIEGAAFGGGLGLVCVTDIAICTADTRFALSETGLGIPPAQIIPFVVRRIGQTTARRLALTGTRFKGDHAGEIGLVHYVAADSAELDATLNKVLNDIGRCAPGANAATKNIINAMRSAPLESVLDDASEAFAQCMRGDEGKEGVAAFLGKRPANWVEKVD